MQCCPPDEAMAEALIAAHDGDVALLYIYLCCRGGEGPGEGGQRTVPHHGEDFRRLGKAPAHGLAARRAGF
ncbi:MAG: hypothetical protein V8T45_10520 [Oscillospiraceae bacterium]